MVEDLPGQQGIPGQRVAVYSCYGPHSGAVTTPAGQARCSGSDDAVGVPGADCTSRKSERINAKPLAAQPTRYPPVNR